MKATCARGRSAPMELEQLRETIRALVSLRETADPVISCYLTLDEKVLTILRKESLQKIDLKQWSEMVETIDNPPGEVEVEGAE